MRATLLLLLAPLAVFAHEAHSAAAAAGTHPADPTSRYASMLEQSPFALATVVEAPPEPTESFTANWELTGIAKLLDEKGEAKDFITIRSRDRRLAFSLFGDQVATEDEAKGVSIHSVDRQDGARRSTVMLKRGAELGKVEFSQESNAAVGTPQINPNAVGGSAAQMRQVQVQQMQAQQAQQAQQARVQQMQNTLTFGVGKTPAVVNPAASRPMNGAAVQNLNGLNPAVPANAAYLPNGNGVIFPAPTLGSPAVPNGANAQRKVRSIKTQ